MEHDTFVLICGQYLDPHILKIVENLSEKKVPYIFLERYRNDHFLQYQYTNHTIQTIIRIKDKIYQLQPKNICSVYWRIKPSMPAEIAGASSTVVEKFSFQEWRDALHFLYSFFTGSLWINPIYKQYYIRNKLNQLKLAVECQLNIPETLITNDKRAVIKFFNNHPQVLYKTISSFILENHSIFSTKICKKTIEKMPVSAIALAPGTYQNLIKKNHELRVTIVGEKIYIAKINSQKYLDNKIDWRKKYYDDMFEPGVLSRNTTENLLKFHKKTGLIYAAYDFIVDINGKEFFLECNPGGQWLWLEDTLGFDISHAIADQLMSPLLSKTESFYSDNMV